MLAPQQFEEGRDAKICRELFQRHTLDGTGLVTLLEIMEATNRKAVPYGAIHTAIRRVRRDSGQNWENDFGIGYRLRSSEENPESGKRHRDRARKQFKTGLEKLRTADPAQMSPTARTRHILETSVAEIGLAATAPRAISNISQRAERAHNELGPDELVASIKDALTRRI
jgi:hypothetical protein